MNTYREKGEPNSKAGFINTPGMIDLSGLRNKTLYLTCQTSLSFLSYLLK